MSNFPNYIFIDDSTMTRVSMNNSVVTEMEVGPNKKRPIQSIPLFIEKFDVAMPVTKLADFNNWFVGDLGSGNRWFLLNDPFDGVKRRFRFVETEIEWAKAGNLLRSSFTLEAYDDLQSGI